MGLYLVTKDMPGYRSGRHTISPDSGHKHRHLYSCRASPSGALCSISIHKGARLALMSKRSYSNALCGANNWLYICTSPSCPAANPRP